MAKRTAPKTPATAYPVSLTGEAACELADALGIGVQTHALRGERTVSTAEARAFFARGREQGAGPAWDEAMWLVTSWAL